jgi:hypothetical protein
MRNSILRHCERCEAIDLSTCRAMDFFAALNDVERPQHTEDSDARTITIERTQSSLTLEDRAHIPPHVAALLSK